MPCYQTISWHDVQFGDLAILGRAVVALGWSMSGNTIVAKDENGNAVYMELANGKLGGANVTTAMVNVLKGAYSRETVKTAAKKFGWSVQTTGKTMRLSRGV